MKNFFHSMGVFLRALPHFLLFEMLYKTILLAVGAPVLSALLELTMKISRVNYLDDESLLVYLHSPVTIFVLLIVVYVSGFFTFIEFSALAACFTCCAKHEKLTIGGMILTGLKSFRKAFRTASPLKFAVFMLFISLSEFSLSASAASEEDICGCRRQFGYYSLYPCGNAFRFCNSTPKLLAALSCAY